MLDIVKVKTLYDNISKYYKVDSDLLLHKGMFLIGMTCFGEDIVEVVCPKKEKISEKEWHDIIEKEGKKSHFSFEPILFRVAEDYEYVEYKNNIKQAEEYKLIFQQKIKEHHMDMKIVQLYHTYLKDRLICIYTASQRVDFRDLVKDLGSHCKQRIELFQISLKDVFSAGQDQCGMCGRSLCCSLGCGVSNRDQKNGIKSAKTFGVCGRIKCCMYFDEMRKDY